MSEAVDLLTLDEAILRFDQTVANTQEIRLRLASKLMNTVEQFEVKPEEDNARVTEVKVATIGTLTSLLNDIDRSSKSRADIKLKQKETDTNNKTSQMVAELLREFNGIRPTNGNSIDLEATSTALEQKFLETGQEISETELRTDPNDLS